MEKRTARNWYWWLWLSPLITVPSLILLTLFIIFFYDPGAELVCGGNWRNCNHAMAGRIDILIIVFASALCHLILLIPASNKKNPFVRWHGRQALLLAGLRTAVPLAFGLIFGFDDVTLGFIPVLIAVWFFGTLWGQLQAARGKCTLMHWFGQAEALPTRKPVAKSAQIVKPKPVQITMPDPETLINTIRHNHNPEQRNKALLELEKLGLVETL